MRSKIIGRRYEQHLLDELYQSKQAEFVVVYGRRRVGKTYLIREMYEGTFTFYHTALSPFDLLSDGELLYRQQLEVFGQSLREYGDYHSEAPKSWLEAFSWLRELLERQSRRKRLVVFLDELPWMDTPRSGFAAAFEHFWNGWGAGQRNLMLIVCGSAASWINDKLINNTSGLYGRTTREIHLSPFTLNECEQFFTSRKIEMDRYDLLQCYMVMGGIPYYLSYIEKGTSLAQNIDRLFFSKSGKLQLEFERLFKSLFSDAGKYIKIVQALSTRREGLTRKEIVEKTGITSGGGLTSILQSLEASDFIIKYVPYGGSSRDTHYKLIDLFTLFYMSFIESGDTMNQNFWQSNLHSASLNAWRGISFEEVCYVHQTQIKKALGISGVHAEIKPWRSKTADDHTQIDMLIDRDDRIINLCEMKYSTGELSIDKSYDAVLRGKIQSFLQQAPSRKAVHLTLITTYGLKPNKYSGRAQSVVTMDDLFEKA